MSEVKNKNKSNVSGKKKNNVNAKKSTGNVNNSNANRTKMKKVSTNRKKQNRQGAELLRKSLKDSSGFAWGLLVNLVIAFLIIELFSKSFNFAYDIFSNTAYQPMNEKAVVVNIPADSSILEIGEALEDAKVIESKYVFFAKVKIKGYGSILMSGKFGLSPSMTYDEIFKIICKKTVSEEEEKKE